MFKSYRICLFVCSANKCKESKRNEYKTEPILNEYEKKFKKILFALNEIEQKTT